jgi:hypothetical protein
MSEENVGAFKRTIEAANRQDVEALPQEVDPEVGWPPSGVSRRAWRGSDRVSRARGSPQGIPRPEATGGDSKDLTKFDTTFNKRKTGAKTFYVMARCKKNKWSTTETTSFYSGETLSASSTGKCKKR